MLLAFHSSVPNCVTSVLKATLCIRTAVGAPAVEPGDRKQSTKGKKDKTKLKSSL